MKASPACMKDLLHPSLGADFHRHGIASRPRHVRASAATPVASAQLKLRPKDRFSPFGPRLMSNVSLTVRNHLLLKQP